MRYFSKHNKNYWILGSIPIPFRLPAEEPFFQDLHVIIPTYW